MTNFISVSSDNQLIIDQEKLGAILDLENHPVERQMEYLQQAINQSLVQQAGMLLNAALLDRDRYRDSWLRQKGSEATQMAYRKAIDDFYSYLDGIGVSSPVLATADHVDDYLEELKLRYSENSVRARISSCASFFSYLKRLRKVEVNPFHGLPLPKKRYKKAIRPDQVKSIPVMNTQELEVIMDSIKRQMIIQGIRSCDHKVRLGAKKLFLAVHFMSRYGLRAGAIQTIELYEDFFSYLTKGGKSGTKSQLDDTKVILSQGEYGRRPLAGYKKISMQVAFKKLCNSLYEKGQLRYAYSCHDLRHYFAHEYYEEHRDIVGLRNELDHASINVTDVYLQSIGMK